MAPQAEQKKLAAASKVTSVTVSFVSEEEGHEAKHVAISIHDLDAALKYAESRDAHYVGTLLKDLASYGETALDRCDDAHKLELSPAIIEELEADAEKAKGHSSLL